MSVVFTERDSSESATSIVIPSFNRGTAVAATVEKCLKLRPAPLEIILVDDGSGPESEQILRSLAGERVQYIRLPENVGQATSRSIGFATARGTCVVSLDDDSWFLDEDAIARVERRFATLPECGILAFRLFTPGETVEPAEDRLFRVSDHITCGAAYRTSMLRAIGYHLQFLRYTGEESDLSIKAMAAGWDIVLDHSVRIHHDYDPSRRTRASLDRVRKYAVRNDLLRPWVYFPLGIALKTTAWRVFSHLRFGLRHGYIASTWQGYLCALVKWPQAIRHRRPLCGQSVERYLALRGTKQPYTGSCEIDKQPDGGPF
jgi:GT2 family glycosyltransferase